MTEQSVGAASVPGSILDNAPCGFVAFGDDGRIVLVNATLADRLGYTRDELVGRHVETMFTIAARVFYQTHLFPLVRMHGHAQEIFLLLRTKSGEDVGTLCNAVRRERDGSMVTDCVLMEVRERRKYEDALLEAKRVAERATTRLEAQAVELEAQREQMQDQATELEAQADAMQTLNDELTARSVELEAERAAARAAEQAAEAANRAKSEFLATMSHELRTPLNAIGGYTQLLHDEIYGPLAPAQIEALDRIDRSQRHLLGLINDILNLARVESGRVDYVLEDLPLAPLIQEFGAMIEPQIATKGLAYRVLLPETPVWLRADREKVIQILLNVLSNAVKFTARGGTITLSCTLDAASNVVAIDVADTGRGIPAHRIESVFEPFVQVRADQATPNEGTGLGLAISRNLARGMGGDLTATSEPGTGSTFTLALPVASM